MSEAIINKVRVGAAHDGEAELIVTLVYENGASAEISLDHAAASHLLDGCAATSPEALIGKSWRRVRDALAASSNRFLKNDVSEQG